MWVEEALIVILYFPFPVQNKKVHSPNKRNYSKENTQKQGLSLILPQDLTKIDEEIKPFWNSLSTEIHCILWQPHQIELPEQGFFSLDGFSNYQEGKSNFWKKQIIPNRSIRQPSSPSSLRLSIPTTENEAQNAIISKKIRIYPKNENLWFDSLNLYRRAYNLTIEFMRKGRKPSSEFRSQICEWCFCECEENEVSYNSNLIQAAYKKACETRTAVIKNRIQGKKSELTFMSRCASSQYFVVPRLSSKKEIYPRILQGCRWSEIVPDEAKGKTAIVTYTNAQWFVSVRKEKVVSKPKREHLSIVALDPGVRTFQTAFSDSEATQYGDKFVETKLVPLMLGLDHLLSWRDKLFNESKTKQWVQDRLKHCNSLIHQVRIRQQNLVADLHRRVAYDLVSNHDVI